MNFAFLCDCCGEPLEEPGALYFGVPHKEGTARKRHICVRCVPKVEALFRRVVLPGRRDYWSDDP